MEPGEECKGALKRTSFWLTLLWLPVIGFSLLGYMGNMMPLAGIVLPIGLLILVAVCTCAVAHFSGMLKEDAAMGDQSVVAGIQRLSTTSLSGRGGSRDDLGQSLPRSGSQLSRDLQGGRSGMPIQPSTFGQQAAGVGVGARAPSLRAPDFGRWQCAMDHGNWIDFAEEQQSDFNKALLHGLDKVEFTVAKQRYELIFGTAGSDAVQRNIRSGKERRVRCFKGGDSSPPPARQLSPPVAAPKVVAAPPARGGSFGSGGGSAFPRAEWQVQMDSGRWIDMDAVSNTIINDAKSRGSPNALFRTHGQDLELTFATSMQKNTKTGKERPIRMKPGGDAFGAASAGGLGAATPSSAGTPATFGGPLVTPPLAEPETSHPSPGGAPVMPAGDALTNPPQDDDWTRAGVRQM